MPLMMALSICYIEPQLSDRTRSIVQAQSQHDKIRAVEAIGRTALFILWFQLIEQCDTVRYPGS